MSLGEMSFAFKFAVSLVAVLVAVLFVWLFVGQYDGKQRIERLEYAVKGLEIESRKSDPESQT